MTAVAVGTGAPVARGAVVDVVSDRHLFPTAIAGETVPNVHHVWLWVHGGAGPIRVSCHLVEHLIDRLLSLLALRLNLSHLFHVVVKDVSVRIPGRLHVLLRMLLALLLQLLYLVHVVLHDVSDVSV